MNKTWVAIIDFAVRSFIVIVLTFLVMFLLFMPQFQRIAENIEMLDDKIVMYTDMFISINPEALYLTAMRYKQEGKISEARHNMVLAIRIAESRQAKYLKELKELMAEQ